MTSRILACLLGIIVALQLPAGAAALAPLQLDDLLSITRFPFQTGPKAGISPDGTEVFYGTEPSFMDDSTGVNPFLEGRKQLWVERLSDRAVFRIGDPNADSWEAVWSPDGKELAFYTGSGRVDHLAVWDVATHTVHAFNILIDAARGPHPFLSWTPDSGHILVPEFPGNRAPASAAAPTPSPTPGIVSFKSIPTKDAQIGKDTIGSYQPTSSVDFVLVNVKTGESKPVAKNVAPDFYSLSPDGTKLLYTISTGIISGDINDRVVYDVYVADVAKGTSKRIARGILSNFASPMTWSHDGSKIAFAGGNLQNDAGVLTGDYGSAFPAWCYIIDLRHPEAFRRISDQTFLRQLITWSDDDSTIYAMKFDLSGIAAIDVATGKETALVRLHNGTIGYPGIINHRKNQLTFTVTRDDGASEVRRLDLRSGKQATLFHGFISLADVSFSRSDEAIAYIGEDVAHPADVWVAGAGFRNARQLTHLNPQIEQRELSDREETVTWHARNGEVLHGVLLLPVGYQAGKRYPTISWVYAGARQGTDGRNRFGFFGEQRAGSYFNLQLLASRGYAVFVPNSKLRIGHPMRDIADTILPGVDKTVEMGVADSSRLGVYGQSYGGYTTLSLIVQTNKFKVAIATSGLSDMVSNYGLLQKSGEDWTGWAESEQGRMGGTPWQYRKRYIENSPLFYLDRVQTPVLLEYGDADEAVAPYQSREAFVGLRRLGKTATLVGYPGEGHVLSTTEHQRDFWKRMMDWLHTYLPAHP